MNLEEVVYPITGIRKDAWSDSCPSFGDKGQLKVIGWSGETIGSRYYILECSECSQDKELYGEGYFKSDKYNLMQGKIPCGCSASIKWSYRQYQIKCERKAKELGYKFLSFSGEWEGYKTKIIMLCSTHGEWGTGSIRNLLNLGRGCPVCKLKVIGDAVRKPDDIMIESFLKSGSFSEGTQFCRVSPENGKYRRYYWSVYCPDCKESNLSYASSLKKGYRPCACGKEVKRIATIKTHTKPDEVMIKSFLESGAFHADTKFWRSDRLNGQGSKVYWYTHCPECDHVGESQGITLQSGNRPCACNMHRQQECYINWIIDGDSKVAIKFGIANNSKQRVKQQNLKSIYEVIQYQVYKFPDVASCKKAERECKKELECGILLKRDMPDGYSETTWVYNLSKIQDIYKRNGGELI